MQKPAVSTKSKAAAHAGLDPSCDSSLAELNFVVSASSLCGTCLNQKVFGARK